MLHIRNHQNVLIFLKQVWFLGFPATWWKLVEILGELVASVVPCLVCYCAELKNTPCLMPLLFVSEQESNNLSALFQSQM